jgi:hypothetical protein
MNPATMYLTLDTEESSLAGVVGDLSLKSPSLDATKADVEFADFRSFKGLKSRDARAINRVVAAKISDEEYDRWEAERGALVTKQFSGGLSNTEQNHLVYVEWNLARIEDAKYGAALDALDAAVSRYEEFAERIEHLQEQLKEVTIQYQRDTSARSRG